MRISEWSSDVCSSDLGCTGGLERVGAGLLLPFVREGDGAHVEQQGLIRAVVDAALADRHRADRVAVLAVLKDEDTVTILADVGESAERHLERDLDAGRTRVGEEDAGQRNGGAAEQPGAKSFGGRTAGRGEWTKM